MDWNLKAKKLTKQILRTKNFNHCSIVNSAMVSASIFFLSFLLLILPLNSYSLFPKQALPTKSGYLPINSTSGSAIFFAFYEAQHPSSSLSQTPILVWLQGGPGCSSMIGNFFELGPWRVSSDSKSNESIILKSNPGAWNRKFGVVFIDNPIGAGFSIASSPEEIPVDQETVAKHLFIALRSFISLEKLWNSRPIYITGESYAGKYVPSIGYYILRHNSHSSVSEQVNLQGVAIGNGLTHPVTQVATHADTAYFSGLINEKQRTQLEVLQAEAVRLTQEQKWAQAADARNQVLRRLENMTGLATLYDLRRKKPYEMVMVTKFLENEEIKKALGVNKSIIFEECSGTVGKALHEDVMKSAKYMVQELVKKSKVLLYQGQFDLRDGVVSTEAWIKELRWEGLEKFLKAERKVWKVNGEVAGYVQKWASLTEVVVSGAGHLVPTDQALSSQAMIEDRVLENGLFGREIGVLASKLKCAHGDI
ncbi:serine carboxypeptidase-like 50 [Papaver somniferum]|uniref:serine carboxypeptidase-like 50 n=1 Tax=Papaver somniferum TaxID=3469 RepID=UPI000E700740|nr:serine carboxypeptidase-like 50 [Papaver somniferum]